MFLPYFISWVAVSYIAYAFFVNKTGFIDNTVLKLFGIDSIDFYAEPSKWPAIIVFFHLWKYTGYNLIVYIASLSGISGEYYEAAELDGASKWQQVKYITLPMLKTTMVILTLIAVGRIFNGDFDLFYNVPRNTSMLYDTTQVLDTYVYNCMINLNDVSMTAAAGIFQAVVGCVVVLLANLGVRKVDNDSALF
jgi:putative aldouronate transport system permease protein